MQSAIYQKSTIVVHNDQPLIGLVIDEDGTELVHYIAGDEAADAILAPNTLQEALDTIGAWSDLDWAKMSAALYRIRHDSTPTPPIEL